MCSDTLSHGAHVGDAGSNFVPNPFKPLFSVQSLAMVLVVYFVLFFILDFIYFLYFSSLCLFVLRVIGSLTFLILLNYLI